MNRKTKTMKSQTCISVLYRSMAVPVERGSPKRKGLLRESSPVLMSKLLLYDKQKKGTEVSKNPSVAPYVAISTSNRFLGVFNRGRNYCGSYFHFNMAG